MKPYMSYWSGGYRKIPDQYLVNLHKICAFYLKKNFGEAHFLADSQSYSYFKDVGFTSVQVVFDDLPREYGNQVWNLSKIYAFRLISEKGIPFIHVDYDVILWEGIEGRLKKSQVFGQGHEDNSYKWYELDKLKEHCPRLYQIKKDDYIKDALNMGIFGGNNLDFINKYANSSLEFILDPENKDFWLNYNGFNFYWQKSTIVEQYYIVQMAKNYNQEIDTLLKFWPPCEKEARSKRYTHLMAGKERDKTKRLVSQLVDKLNL